MVGFRDLVGTGIAPVSKKTAVKESQDGFHWDKKEFLNPKIQNCHVQVLVIIDEQNTKYIKTDQQQQIIDRMYRFGSCNLWFGCKFFYSLFFNYNNCIQNLILFKVILHRRILAKDE